MREINVKLYQYSELSDEAKENALENFPECFREFAWDGDWEYCMECLKDDMTTDGLEDITIISWDNSRITDIEFYIPVKDIEAKFGYEPDWDEVFEDSSVGLRVRNGYLVNEGTKYYRTYSWIPHSVEEEMERGIKEYVEKFIDAHARHYQDCVDYKYEKDFMEEEYGWRETEFLEDGTIYQHSPRTGW